ncbi:MAG: phosphotransferase [Colwellia sp.]|nr:phosphotransferase [Colwellia sp.]
MKNVKEIIEQLTLLSFFDNDNIIDVNKIAEGASHHCFKVVTASATYFAKYFETDRITQKVEFEMTIMAAKSMLAPPLLFHSNHWFISDFIDAAQLINDHTINERVIITAELINKCHKLSLKLPTLDLHAVLISLATDKALSHEQSKAISSIITKLPVMKVGQVLVVCHGDVNFSNIIFTEPSYLIDFECACLAEPEYDLAMMSAINLLNKTQRSVLFSTYQKDSLITLSHAKLASYLPYCYLINGLWYLLKFNVEQQSNLFVLSQKQFAAFDDLMGLNSKLVTEMR